jgi:hypothetical protein
LTVAGNISILLKTNAEPLRFAVGLPDQEIPVALLYGQDTLDGFAPAFHLVAFACRCAGECRPGNQDK